MKAKYRPYKISYSLREWNRELNPLIDAVLKHNNITEPYYEKHGICEKAQYKTWRRNLAGLVHDFLEEKLKDDITKKISLMQSDIKPELESFQPMKAKYMVNQKMCYVKMSIKVPENEESEKELAGVMFHFADKYKGKVTSSAPSVIKETQERKKRKLLKRERLENKDYIGR